MYHVPETCEQSSIEQAKHNKARHDMMPDAQDTVRLSTEAKADHGKVYTSAGHQGYLANLAHTTLPGGGGRNT